MVRTISLKIPIVNLPKDLLTPRQKITQIYLLLHNIKVI
jgi:hypothetical protein